MTAYTFDQIIDFTRTSAATYVANTGFVTQTPASRNLLTYTQEFDNAAWTKTNSQIVPNVNPAAASLGSELVTNGDFASGTGWTANAGWAIGSGVATATATSTSLFGGGFTPTAGRLYRVDFDVVSYTSGTLAITVGANYTGESSLTGGAMAAGRKTVYVVSGTNTSRGVEFYGGAISAVIDNVSVREVIGGLITAPDGTLTGDALIEDTINSRHSLSQTATIAASATHTVSVYVKAGTGRYFTLSVSRAAAGSVYYAARYDLQTATVTATGTGGGGGTHTASSITAVGNGWYRCVLTGTLSTFTDAVVMASGAANSTGFGDRGAEVYTGTSSTWFLWGFQFEQASSASTYTRNVGGVYPPRFDYDPVTLAPRGLLIEEQRTNLLTYSEQFDNASWTKTAVTATANVTTSPDGTADADSIIETTANSTHDVNQSATLSAVAYTYSAFVKANGRSWVRLFVFQSGPGSTSVWFNVSTGAIGTVGAGASNATITNFGNGWYRCAFTFTAIAASASLYAQLATADNGASTYTGDGTSGIYLWGAQLEAGAFATSYIPTVASQVTRTADVATVTGANFSRWYNQSEGTLVVEADSNSLVAGRFPGMWQVTDGGSSNRIGVYLNQAGGVYVTQRNLSGTPISATTSNSTTQNTVFKGASAYSVSGVSGALNGGAVVNSAVGAPPVVVRLELGLFDGYLNGHIRRIRYYPTRLSNAQLQALTT